VRAHDAGAESRTFGARAAARVPPARERGVARLRHSKRFFVDTARETAKIARDLPSARIFVVLRADVPFARQAGVFFVAWHV